VKHDEAMMLLPEYLDGSLPREQHEAITRLLETDAELHRAFEEEKMLDQLLRTQAWVRARPDFTSRVLQSAGVPVPQGEAVLDRVLERLSTYAPVGTLALVAGLYGRAIATRLWDLWRSALGWATHAVGLEALDSNPVLAVTTLAVVAIAGVVVFEFSRRGQSSV
jgi:anti-sigma factor RsiW